MNDIIYDYENDMRDIGIPPIIIEKMKIKNNDTINRVKIFVNLKKKFNLI